MEEKSTTKKIKTEEDGAHFIYLFHFFFQVNTRPFFRWRRINSMEIDYWRIKSMIVDAHSIKGK